MNGMCMLPITRRSTVMVDGSGCGEKGDNADNSSCDYAAGDGGYDSESSASSVCTPRSVVRSTVTSTDDSSNGSNASSRKSQTIEPRQTRAQGIRKLQKCLSTTTSHYELDSSSLNSFPTTSLFSSHRSGEIRSYSSTTPQPSLNYQNILSNTRQYNSFDKYDSSFQRSRSSSMSSLENITTETISCLTFADSYTRKTDTVPVPTLWIGTSLGSIQTVVFNTPPRGERHAHPVVVSTCNGSNFKLKGCILSISFLDYNESQGKCTNSRMSPSMNAQVLTGDGFEDRQFVVLISEKQARVVALPSQNCLYRQQLAETHIVIKAEITTLKDNVCLVCYVSNGHIATYSLPSLRSLIDIDFLPLIDLRIAKTLCFSNRGHGLYLSSPTEIQKFSVSSEFCGELTEMMGDLFIGHDMPEPPKESFFKGLFGGGSRSLDREELFGESSGRASRTVAKHIPGPNAGAEGLRERVTTATGEVNLAHQMVMERGEKLSQLEERTARMMTEAEGFSQSAHGLMLKYKDKKWYQL